ncbi:MAG: type II toxin-antitoxin system VapC family toxin [Armatimonadetes bacterium]|nr:type II toxin-antitoxin system VapC family toxin [Armatimonadota bacterium]
MAVYLDSSALVKLVVEEPESKPLRRFLQRHSVRVSSALARVEVPRAVRFQGGEARTRAALVLSRVQLLRLDDDLLDAAAQLEPGVLRSLDAIHLASAGALGEELEALVTYDARMQEVAGLLGIQVGSPS